MSQPPDCKDVCPAGKSPGDPHCWEPVTRTTLLTADGSIALPTLIYRCDHCRSYRAVAASRPVLLAPDYDPVYMANAYQQGRNAAWRDTARDAVRRYLEGRCFEPDCPEDCYVPTDTPFCGEHARQHKLY